MQTNVCIISLNNDKGVPQKKAALVWLYWPKIILSVRQVWLAMETRALIKSSFNPVFSCVGHKSCELRSFPDKGVWEGESEEMKQGM